eukprot:m.17907 g.17907  ORF g.17907 m.17907 type:complete len:169 (+) comp4857_c0_seq1:174-680(+)
MTEGATSISRPPVISEEVWAAFKAVGHGDLLAAVFQLNDDETKLVLKDVVDIKDGAWPSLEALFDPQQPAWAAICFPYTTMSGGIRSKFMYLSWSPDTLTRPTFKETIRVKSIGIMQLGELSEAFATAGAKRIQANDQADLEIENVLSIAAKFERDEINRDSIQRLEG